MRSLAFATLAVATFSASPASAAETCAGCPRVQLLRAEDQIRIAAEDDHDPYESLRHRVRFVSAAGTSAWSDWADTNAYGMRTTAAGQVEAETIDLEGNVGRGVIHITAPDAPQGTRGPGTVEEDSSVEARWDGDATTPDGTTAADLEPEADRTDANEYFAAQEWDHSVCPVASASLSDEDAACSTVRGPNDGMLAALLALAALVLGRVRR